MKRSMHVADLEAAVRDTTLEHWWKGSYWRKLDVDGNLLAEDLEAAVRDTTLKHWWKGSYWRKLDVDGNLLAEDLEAAVRDTTLKHWWKGSYWRKLDVDDNLLAEDLEALKTFLPTCIIKPHAPFEHLSVSNRFSAFSNVFIALRISSSILVTVASGERSYS